LQIFVHDSPVEVGLEAARHGGDLIVQALRANGRASVILATGNSQLATIESLVARTDIDWSRVEAFHLDEYVGLAASHSASFRNYLRGRFVAKVGNLRAFNYVNGDAPDLHGECERLSRLLSSREIDVAFVGIGENGHLAFNDPPADFETDVPYLVVDLDDRCRRQQVGEGWFASLQEVPRRAITMSVRQMMKSATIVASIEGTRKAQPAAMALDGPVVNSCPASILQRHGDCRVFLDAEAAAQLSRRTDD